MAGKAASQRYQIIDALLTNSLKKFPTKEYILECCREKLDKSLSQSTIEKDLDAMRNDSNLGFHAPIAYCKANKGYYYKDPEYTINKLNLSFEEWEMLAQGIKKLARETRHQEVLDFLRVVEKIGIQCRMDLGVEHALASHHHSERMMEHKFIRMSDWPMAS